MPRSSSSRPVIARDPKNVFALGNAGLIFARRSDYGKAIERLSAAHALDPDSTALALALAEAQIRLGRQADADRLISELRSTGRLTTDAARILASVCLQSGQPAKGAELAKMDPKLAAMYRDAAVRRAQQDFQDNQYQRVATRTGSSEELGVLRISLSTVCWETPITSWGIRKGRRMNSSKRSGWIRRMSRSISIWACSI